MIVNQLNIRETYMKNIISKTVVAGMVAAVAGTAVAEGEATTSAMQETEVSVTADFASAYVFRGVTLNDGAVFQPGIEATGFGLSEECGSITVGVWGNYDLVDDTFTGVSSSSFSETDWYASYGLPTFVDGLDLFVGYTEYSYGAGASDKEANLGAGYEIAGIGLGLTWYQGVGGFIGTQSYVELALGYALEFTEDFSGSIDARFAYLDPSAGTSGFSDYDIGASLGYALGDVWSVGATLTYIGQGDDDVLADASLVNGLGYDVELVGVLSVGASF
jgi:uncharacterized protein (TIGR02001 family)